VLPVGKQKKRKRKRRPGGRPVTQADGEKKGGGEKKVKQQQRRRRKIRRDQGKGERDKNGKGGNASGHGEKGRKWGKKKGEKEGISILKKKEKRRDHNDQPWGDKLNIVYKLHGWGKGSQTNK